ncbi:rod-binding protein [Caulobacter sp.]|uniref:rod-binding protein n=1 Tax=Caulobacter sp. TaxID=78 RepID=UPI003BA99B9B
MSALSSIAAPIDALSKAVTAASTKELAKRGQIKETAQKFEASFLSVMMQTMFEGVKTSEPFGGGQGEEMFKSLLTESMAKEVTKAGGVGLANTVQREMLKLQGLK